MPWIRYSGQPRSRAWSPSGLSGPGGTEAGRSGRSARIDAGGHQVGLRRLLTTVVSPSGVCAASVPIPIAIEATVPSAA